MTQGPFSSDVKCADALQYLANTRKQIAAIRKRESQCKANLGIFDLSLIESLDLIALEKVRCCNFYF